MTEPAREKISRDVTIPQNETGAQDTTPRERHCAFCGAEVSVHGLARERFGETFCSDGHAEEFVKEVRAARIQAAVLRAVEPATIEIERPEQPAPGVPKQQGWKRYLKLGACWGAPLLALVFLAGGGGAALGAAGALLPVLAFLACPLAMYFLMRSMSKMGHQEEPRDPGDDTWGGKRR